MKNRVVGAVSAAHDDYARPVPPGGVDGSGGRREQGDQYQNTLVTDGTTTATVTPKTTTERSHCPRTAVARSS